MRIFYKNIQKHYLKYNNILFDPKRDEVKGDWRKLHNEELHTLYSSPNISRMIKSRRMRWTAHVARIGETRNANRIMVGKPSTVQLHAVEL
jgi:hypothetical protein